MTDQNAFRIAQEFLDHQGDATIAGDVDGTLDFCDIPCTLESIEGRVVAMDREEMRAICKTFIAGLKAKRLTHMVRRCIAAEFKDPDTVWATYETRYVRDNQLLTEEPYTGFVILRHRGDRWKISAMQFDVSGTSPANLTLRQRARRMASLSE